MHRELLMPGNKRVSEIAGLTHQGNEELAANRIIGPSSFSIC